jgi:hypothetical protein
MQLVMDSHALVQESACSNFGKFVESASVQLIPYLNDIFKVF